MELGVWRSKITCPSLTVSSKLGTKICSFAPAGKGLLYPTTASSHRFISYPTMRMSNIHPTGQTANILPFGAKLSYKIWSTAILPFPRSSPFCHLCGLIMKIKPKPNNCKTGNNLWSHWMAVAWLCLYGFIENFCLEFHKN